MHLDDLDIPLRPQPRGCLADEVRQQRNAEGGVAGLEHGDRVRGMIDGRVVALGKAGSANYNGNACADRRMEIGVERLRRREIDQHVAPVGQRGCVACTHAGDVSAACEAVLSISQQGRDGLAHAPLAANNPDARHSSSRCPRVSWPA